MAYTDTVPTVAEIYQANKGIYDLNKFTNETGLTFVDSEGKTKQTLVGLVSDIDWTPKGTFAAGATLTKVTDYLTDATGAQWVYTGTDYPKVVAGGTVPSSPTYQVIQTGSAAVVGTAGRGYLAGAGVIRNAGAGWFIIGDSVHRAVGITSVSISGLDIRIDHTPGAIEVGALIAAVDETFAKKGFIIGSSVGTTISFITITAPLNFTVNTATVTGTLAVPSTTGLTVPSHFGSDIKAYKEGGVVTINHPSVDTNDAPVGNTAGSARKTDFNLAFSTTQTVIQGVGDVDAYIRFDGVSWLATTTLTVSPTMVWDSGTSTLTVTHPDCDIYNISVVPRDDGHVVSVGSIGNTTFTVKFYDKVTGALITSLGTLMKFYVTRKAKALKTDISGSVNIRRGYAQVDAAKVISASGNIWILAINNKSI